MKRSSFGKQKKLSKFLKKWSINPANIHNLLPIYEKIWITHNATLSA